MPTFEMTVHDLRLLLAQEDVDAAFDELNSEYLHQFQEQNVDKRCSMQCETNHNDAVSQCEDQTSPRNSEEISR